MKLRSAAVLLAIVFLATCSAEPDLASLRVQSTPEATVTPTRPAATPKAASPADAPARDVAVAAAAATPTAASAPIGASVGGCPLFPADNPWRRDVSADPVDPRSDAYIASISQGGSFLHADFGSNRDYGIPYVVVPRDQPKVPIRFTDYADESDPGPYPVPLNAPREAGSDRHVVVVQKGKCKLYELFNARRTRRGWAASSGAKFDLRSGALRPAGWTSADAAGLPILPGLVRRSETKAGAINHALRFTAPQTQRGYVDPARHFASSEDDPDLPPMGLRVRLKASYDTSEFYGHARVVLEALKTYGMLLADNGSSWYITGARDTGWDDEDLDQLKSVPGSAFEAVQHGTVHR